MNTLDFILQKYNLNKENRPPLDLSGGRREKGLAGLFAELGFKTGAEIGVQQGEYSEVLCKTIPGLKLFSVDSWKAYKEYSDFKSQRLLDKYEKQARERLADYNCEIIKKFSLEAVKDFEDESLDFVFIDGNHDFQNCTNDIAEWGKKVRRGGIISGHDFWRSNERIIIHCKDVVQAWTYAHGIKPWFIIRGDRRKSWMWVKQ